VLLHAKRWLADLESTSHVLAASNAGHGGGVRIGITTQVAQALLTAALKELLGQSPRLSVFIIEGTADQLRAACSRTSSIARSGRSYEGDAPVIVQWAIYEQEPRLVVAARKQKRRSRGPLNWEKLAELDWILPPPNTPMRRLYNTIFVTAGVPPPVPIMERISVRSMETVLGSEPSAITVVAAAANAAGRTSMACQSAGKRRGARKRQLLQVLSCLRFLEVLRPATRLTTGSMNARAGTGWAARLP